MSEEPDIPVIRNQEYIRPETREPGKLIAASVLFKGKLWTAKRHHICRDNMIEDLKAGENEDGLPIDSEGDVIYMSQDSQGFLTENGYHVRRIPASAIAQSEGQIPIEFDKILTSEDLW